MGESTQEAEFERAPSPSMRYDFPLSGLFAINKPSGVTSMSLLESLKQLFLTSKLFVKHPQSGHFRTDQEKKSKKGRPWNSKNHKLIKVGQGGTLDPLASGVLVIGLNSATTQLSKFLDCSKAYRTTGLLGCKTDSYDSHGKVVELLAWKHVRPEDIQAQCQLIKGEHWQTPPIYSALKMDGKPLYEYARQNIPLPRPIEARRCEVFDIQMVDWKEGGQHSFKWPTEMRSQEDCEMLQKTEELIKQIGVVKPDDTNPSAESNSGDARLDTNQSSKRPAFSQNEGQGSKKSKLNDGAADNQPSTELSPSITRTHEPEPVTLSDNGKSPAFTLQMTVSSGTYVRSIVHDIGQAVSSAATVVSLTRTRQGDFFLDEDTGHSEAGNATKKFACIDWSTFEKAIQSLKDGVAEPRNERGLRPWEQELLNHIHA